MRPAALPALPALPALLLPLVSALPACAPSCERGPGVARLRGRTMGTTWSVAYAPPRVRAPAPARVRERVEALLASVNGEMSTHDPSSAISRINASGEARAWIPAPPGLVLVLARALAAARETDGAFDPTLGPLVDLWGFGPGGSRRAPSPAALREARARTGWRKVEADPARGAVRKASPGVRLDLSGLAKGWAVDKVAELLLGMGLADHMVEIGGEVRAQGTRRGRPWSVGVLAPDGAGGLAVRRTVAPGGDGPWAVASSGTHMNAFVEGGRRYSHIIDAGTGAPVDDPLVSVTVVDADGGCMDADAWATALLAMGLARARAFAEARGLAAFFVHSVDVGAADGGAADVGAADVGGLAESSTSAFAALSRTTSRPAPPAPRTAPRPAPPAGGDRPR